MKAKKKLGDKTPRQNRQTVAGLPALRANVAGIDLGSERHWVCAPAVAGQPRVMALLLALTLFQHLIDGFRNRDLRQQVADLLGVPLAEYTPHQMTYDLRRLRLKGLIYRPPKTNRYFVTPYGWKVARLFSRLEARVFRPAMAMFTANDAVLPFPLRQALDRVDAQLDLLIYEAFPFPKAS